MPRNLSVSRRTRAAIVVAAAASIGLLAIGNADRRPGAQPVSALAARGKYLVDRVSICGDCHTPRLRNGAPDMSRYLQGAELDFAPKHPMPVWSGLAPDITATGLSKITVAQLAAQLEGKAKWAPPMPPYRMRPEDALAVATYLKSITPRIRRR